MNALKTRLTPEEAGKRLGVGRGQISIYIKKGYLKATNVGDGNIRPRWQIDYEDLDNFIKHKDELIPKKRKKINKEYESPKAVPQVESHQEHATELYQVSDAYIRELLEENRTLRKQMNDILSEEAQLSEELNKVKDDNIQLKNDLEIARSIKDKMVEDIFGILASND